MVPVSWLLVTESRVVFVNEHPVKEDGRSEAPPGVTCRSRAAMLPRRASSEAERSRYEARRTVAQYGRQVWELLRGRAMLCVVLFQFLTPIIGGISTTAGGEVKQYW